MICLITGAILSLCSIMGDFRLLRSNFIYIYLISSMLNTIDAIRILSGPKFTKASFLSRCNLYFIATRSKVLIISKTQFEVWFQCWYLDEHLSMLLRLSI